MRHRATFREGRSHHCRDNDDYAVFEMTAVRHFAF